MYSTPKNKKTKEVVAQPTDRGQNVQVFVRCRPLNSQEKAAKTFSAVEIGGTKDVVVKGTPLNLYTKAFQYDRAFGPSSTQSDVYAAVVEPLISQVLQGYNCTVFAYGQTGTGKTYTMEGYEDRTAAKKTWETDVNTGMIPQAVCQIFDDLRTTGDMDAEFSIRVSFLELYNEEIFDLLSPVDDTTKLRLFEDTTKKGSVIIQGLEEVQVRSKSEIYALLDKGSLKKKTAETLMNANSSRSHTVFTVTVHMKESSFEGEEVMRVGKLHLVDLAGSENVARSGASGGRAREAGSINQSLLTLGRVITCLVERTPHIPYRESKLTRLLQDSLGGKTKTSIIATISPAYTNIEETLSTLEYAQRAKNITNRPEINQKLSKVAVLKEYTEEIERLRQTILRAREGEGVYLAQENYLAMINQVQSQEQEIKETIGEMRVLKQEMDSKVQLFQEYEQKLEERRVELERGRLALEKVEGVLEQAKGELHETAKERDTQTHLVEKHLETEITLRQQARKLMVVCDEASSDVVALHDKLDRGRGVEQENESLQQTFINTFHGRVDHLNHILHTYQREQAEKSALVKSQVEAGLRSNTETLVSLARRIHQLTEQNTSLKEIMETEVDFTCRSEVSSLTDHQAEIAADVTKLMEVFATFKDSSVNAFLLDILDLLAKEKTSFEALESLVAASCNEMSEKFEATVGTLVEHILALQGDVVVYVETNSTDLSLITSVTGRMTSSLGTMKTAMETLMGVYQSHLSLLKDSHAQNNQLAEKIGQVCGDMNAVVAEKDQQHTDNRRRQMEQIRMESDSKIQRLRSSVAECEEKNKAEVRVSSTLVENQTVFSDETRHLVAETSSRMEQFTRDRKAGYELAAAELKRKKSSADAHLEEDKENLVACINQSRAGQEYRFRADSATLEALGSACLNFRENYGDQLKIAEAEVLEFVREGLKRDVPTGNTPGPKERSYPRVLSATSPHERIIERFKRNYTIPSLVLPLDDVDGDSVISNSTRTRSTSLNSDIQPFSSVRGSVTDLAYDSEDQQHELFKVPSGLRRPEVHYNKTRSNSHT